MWTLVGRPAGDEAAKPGGKRTCINVNPVGLKFAVLLSEVEKYNRTPEAVTATKPRWKDSALVTTLMPTIGKKLLLSTFKATLAASLTMVCWETAVTFVSCCPSDPKSKTWIAPFSDLVYNICLENMEILSLR